MNNDGFRTLIENMNQPASIIRVIFNEIGDPVDYITLYMNPASEIQLGLKREEIMGRRAKEISPNAEQEWLKQYGEVVKTGMLVSYERYSSTFNKYFNNQLIPLGNDKVGILFQDITEVRVEEEVKKSAIEALQKSEERYRGLTEQKIAETELRDASQLIEYQNRKLNAIIQSLPHSLVIYDKNANPIFYNEQALKSYSKAIENKDIPISQRVQAMRPQHKVGGSAATEEMPIMRALKGEVVRDLEMSYTSKSGERVWVSSTIAPIRNDYGEINEAVATYVDITERKHIEDVLRESEEKYRQIVETANEGISLVNPDFRIRFANEKLAKMLGYSVEEIIGRSFLDFLDSEGKTAGHVNMKKRQSGMNDSLEYKFIRKDGSYFWVLSNTLPIMDDMGNLNYVLSMVTDITERKKVEEVLQESERNALDLVEKLRIADKNKSDFINMLSHELRNPLASIMMGLELLEKAPSGERQSLMALDIIKRQGKQLTNLVNDLLDTTRITQNKVNLKKETIEINNLIDKAVQDYYSQFIDKNVKLEVKLTKPLYIEADYSRLTQVISNLLHNAAKFTNKNDLVIVSVTEDTNTSEVVITVKDTGRGMDPKDQLNLFEPFMQVDKSLDRKLGGLGLGLSIVKGIVELHGGRVEAFSEGIGKGTKFTIRLPL